LDLAIIFLFLVALVLVSRTKEQIIQRDRTSYGFLVSGVCILTFMSLFTAIQNQLVEQKLLAMPALAIAELFRLLMLVSGLVLVTSAISRWLPIFNNKEVKKESFATEHTLLKRWGRLLSTQLSIDEFLRKSLEIISDNLQISMGTVYSVSPAKNMAKLVASIGRFDNLANISERFVLNQIWLKQLSGSRLTPAIVSFSELHPHASGNCYCFPVKASGQLQFLYLLWTKDKQGAETFDQDILSGITDSVKERLHLERLVLRNNFNKVCREIADTLKAKVVSGESINEKLVLAKTELQTLMPVDFISLSLMGKGGSLRRMSIGPSGTILNEVDVQVGSDNSYLYQVSEGHKALLISDISLDRSAELPELLLVSTIKSLMAVPLGCTGQTRGVLSVGAQKPGVYGKVEKEILTSITVAFESILHEMNLEEQALGMREREKLVREFATEIAAGDSQTSLFSHLVSTIKKVLDCPIIRVSTIDTGAKFLSSQTLVNASKSKVRTPESGHLILSLLHWHKVAQENGNTVVVNCHAGENGMPDIESMQVFSPGVKRAVIVPIKCSDRILGLISLADDKVIAASSLTETNIQFVETIAALAGVALDTFTRSKNALSEFAAVARGEIVDAGHRREMRRQLRSSLTSIIGSLEMIRSGDSSDETKRDRFLTIIDKSAQKMSEYLTE